MKAGHLPGTNGDEQLLAHSRRAALEHDPVGSRRELEALHRGLRRLLADADPRGRPRRDVEAAVVSWVGDVDGAPRVARCDARGRGGRRRGDRGLGELDRRSGRRWAAHPTGDPADGQRESAGADERPAPGEAPLPRLRHRLVLRAAAVPETLGTLGPAAARGRLGRRCARQQCGGDGITEGRRGLTGSRGRVVERSRLDRKRTLDRRRRERSRHRGHAGREDSGDGRRRERAQVRGVGGSRRGWWRHHVRIGLLDARHELQGVSEERARGHVEAVGVDAHEPRSGRSPSGTGPAGLGARAQTTLELAARTRGGGRLTARTGCGLMPVAAARALYFHDPPATPTQANCTRRLADPSTGSARPARGAGDRLGGAGSVQPRP